MTETPSATSKLHGRVEYVDVLRFVAALSVVAFHWLYNGVAGGKVISLENSPAQGIIQYGSIGVAQFFAISGFVIGFSATKSNAGRFAAGRALRLFPAFWVALGITTVVILIWGQPVFAVTAPQFFANLTMVPQLLGQAPIDGVYWTLTVELIFYLAIFALLFCGLGSRLDVILPIWSLTMLVLSAAGIHSIPLLGGYFAYFAGGALIDLIRRQGATAYRLIGLAAALGSSILFTFTRIDGWAAGDADPSEVFARIGLNIACFGAVALALIPRIASLRIPGSKLFGSLTYPMYLLHAHIGYIVLNRFASDDNYWFVLAVMLFGLIVASWLLHEVVENRMSRIWRSFFSIVLERPIVRLQNTILPNAAPHPNSRPRETDKSSPQH
jgi:peptidoglycan/LPS O-acetylase OafA/YrhL